MKWHLFAVLMTVSSMLAGSTLSLPSSESAATSAAVQIISPSTQQEGETIFQKTVNYWIDELAQQKGFESWKNARWSSEPLGAQMHSWVIEIRSGDVVVGYMVMGADAAGSYRLLEYGQGTYPLFNTSLLSPYLESLGIAYSDATWTRIYHHPLESFWYAETSQGGYLFDAKNGEYYETDSQKLRGLINLPESAGLPGMENEHESLTVHARMTLKETTDVPSFDPFLTIPWVGQDPLSEPLPQLIADFIKSGQHITYTQRIIAGEMILPLAVSGFHIWTDGELQIYYFAVDQEGQRFIPYVMMTEKGSFYSEPIS
ncbi:hypothetical protein [Marinicrinis lubricantis]|uniref:Uncharacterized protein n=1 Tax=Marinicrinis lubricantis TaxID=2086470 RepID=A0ABW1INR3_9BACL